MRTGAVRFLAVSLGGHIVLGVALASAPGRTHHEVTAISFVETKKPKPPHPFVPPPEAPRPPPEVARAHQAKTAPPKPEAAPAVEAHPGTGSPTDALPDFGLSLSSGAAGGLAVPAGNSRDYAPPARAAKTLSRSGAAGRDDDCSEPAAKPRLVSQGAPPAYSEDARSAGVSGKVRVEITVDEHGRVVRVRLIQGLGHGLDEAALEAARAMTFEAAARCGRPTSATFNVSFRFAPPP
jgi:protein TonB